MYEYKCKKCSKKYQHFLKLYHPCSCGGVLQYVYEPVSSKPFPSVNPNSPAPKEFIPIRRFAGGFQEVWYWRRKPRKRLKTKGIMKL